MDQDTDHTPALLFDLDGTLIDSVYQHVLAWHEALEELGLSLAVWRIHRRIGTSLTPRQREVLPLVISGLLNKQIAGVIGTSETTVKVHRGQLTRKMGANSFAELVRMAEKLEIASQSYKPS